MNAPIADLASRAVGRPDVADLVVVRGRVEHGDQRGRELGFPTANLGIGERDIDDGVWAGWLDRADGRRLPAAISVGRRATVYQRGVRLLEAHVLGFDGDLYDEIVTVWLAKFLRRQQRFDGLDALVTQLRRDVDRTHRWCRTTAWVAPLSTHELPAGGVVRVPAEQLTQPTQRSAATTSKEHHGAA